MPPVVPDDWAVGLAKPLRQLIDDGANDDELWQFIQAKQKGDDYGANLILNKTRLERLESMPSDPGYEHAAVVTRLTVAALRPMVNVLDVRLLYQYVHDVWHLAELVVRTTEGESYWSHESYIRAIADVIRRLAIDRGSAHGHTNNEMP